MIHPDQWLHGEYTIDTPENVTFGYEIAGIGSRFIGTLIDTVVVTIALLFLNLLLGTLLEVAATVGVTDIFASTDEEISFSVGIILALYVLLNFFLIFGYFIIFELIWNGQTVGKRVVKIRVVRVNGNPAGFLEIVVRNLVRMVDFLPVAYGVGLGVMFANQHARRLGDFAAGTLVIKEETQVTLENLYQLSPSGLPGKSDAAQIEVWRQQFPALRRMQATDYDLIQQSLHRHDRGQLSLSALFRLADAIARKVESPPPNRDWQSARAFLHAVADAYRNLGS